MHTVLLISFIQKRVVVVIQVCLLYLVFAAFSCKQAPVLTQDEKNTIADSIRQTLSNYYKDIKQSGLTAEFKYLDHSPEFFWVPPGYTGAISYDSIEKILTQNAPAYKMIDNVFDTLRIIPLTKELATYTGRIHSAITDTSGKTIHVSLLETGTVIKRPEGWKLLNGQTSVTTP